jgi:DNA-binding PadR family transcriptional regulator
MRSKTDVELLSRVEELLLLVVGELGEGAYGVPIRRRLGGMLGRRLSVGSVYVPLERLVERGLLTAEAGEPTPVRGGRRKRFYRLSPRGSRALLQTRRITERAWAAVRKAGLRADLG